MDSYHEPVLLNEVLESLSVERERKYIDATLGGGGHSFEILKKGGKVLGLDVDEEAIEYVKNKLEQSSFKLGEDLILVRKNFRNIEEVAFLNGFDKVCGILFDLGVSSHQLDDRIRGFSFQKEGPLDMRMDKELGVKAADLLQILTKGELYELFTKLGEENNAFAISRAIIRAREIKRIETTSELAQIIEQVSHKKFSKVNPATRVFQALRIAVNDELNSLKEALPKAIKLLDKKGKLLVISFHSLEDRIVKQAFEEFEEKGIGSVLTKKPIIPTEEEIVKNRRSRSAKLRVFEKN